MNEPISISSWTTNIKALVGLDTHLRYRQKGKKPYASHHRPGKIPNRVSIDDRTAMVEKRLRLGDRGLDIIIGRKHCPAQVSLVERKSRLSLIAYLANKGTERVKQNIIDLCPPLSKVHRLTSDKGKEFSADQSIGQSLAANFYFAHPDVSWQTRLNQNTNGRIRQYFVKSTSWTDISEEQINRLIEKLNNRPPKSLGIKTPNQAFFRSQSPVALES